MAAIAETTPTWESSDIRVVANVRTARWHLSNVIAFLREAGAVTLDAEATGKNPMTATPLLLQVGNESRQYVVVLPTYTADELRPLLALLAQRLIIGHNLNYDYRLLRSFYRAACPPWRDVYDTMLAEAVLTMGDFDTKKQWLHHLSLAQASARYGLGDMEKDTRLTFTEVDVSQVAHWRPTEEQVVYAAKDVAITHRLAHAQYEALEEQSLLRAAKLRMGALVPLAEVEMRGMRIDVDSWRAYLAEMRVAHEQSEGRLVAALNPYEQSWRRTQFEDAFRAHDAWQQAKAAEEEKLRDEWEECIRRTGVPWGRHKLSEMRQWREEHPNPGSPKLDVSLINLASHEQVKHAFAGLGLEIPLVDGKPTIDAKARGKMLLRANLTAEQRTILEEYATFTKLGKFLSSFGENLLSQVTSVGRLHTRYNIGLTETGRMSSEAPNFQNFPRDNRLRHCFLADAGTVVLTADFKSQELCISAALSGDEQMRAQLAAGTDLYKEVASRVFNVPLSAVSKEQRQMCKNAMLGMTYGISTKGLWNNYRIPEEMGSQLLAWVRKSYPRFAGWSDELVTKALRDGYVTTASGARRFFRQGGQEAWKLSTESRNAPVQGTAADIVYALAARLERYAVPHGFLPVNFVHDEAVVLLPEPKAKDGEAFIVAQMQAAFHDVLPYEVYGVTCGVDTHIAPYWTKD